MQQPTRCAPDWRLRRVRARGEAVVLEASSGWRTGSARGSLPGITTALSLYRGVRFAAEVIEHAVWLYHRFSLSLRDVETILAARGIIVVS